jgi:diacylglycerol kinase (ATP)
MKYVEIIHNPGAGDEKYNKEELMALLKDNGYETNYNSTQKKGWKEFDAKADLLIVAGGDGTIRKVAEELLEEKLLNKPNPIALLPLGTANNITKSLGIAGDTKDLIRCWKNGKVKSYDVGRVYNIADHKFFLESFGYGVFPYLMQEMKKRGEENIESPEEKLQTALTLFHQIIQSYEPKFCKLEVDVSDHSGKFLLAEIMNTPSIGPNLLLSPLSDPGDGEFEIVLVPEQHKEKFASYVAGKLKGQDETYSFHTLKGKNITISWEGTHVHLDDQFVKLEKGLDVSIQMKKGLLEFLVP